MAACTALGLSAMLWACSNNDALIKTSAGYPPVDIAPSGLPDYAVGDSFTYDNPGEIWTVAAIADGLITWRSSLGTTKKTVFDPFLPPVEWAAGDERGAERITKWDKSLFPLSGGEKIAFQSTRRAGPGTAAPFEWKCYSGKPREVTVKAGAFAAYPVFCRRSDGLTEQRLYAPEVKAALLITTRKHPAPATTRELVAFTLATGKRVAAPTVPGLPRGWALAAVEQPAPKPDVQAPATVASATRASPLAPGDKRIPDGRNSPTIAAPPAPSTAAAKTRGARVATEPSIAPTPSIAPPSIAAPPTVAAASGDVPKPAPSNAPAPAPSIAPTPTIAPPSTPIITPPAPAPDTASKARGPTGGFGVQLASYRRSAYADSAWPKLQQRLRPLLDNTPHVVQRADLGPPKGVFYRLVAGPFSTRDQAAALCRSIHDRRGACLVSAFNR